MYQYEPSIITFTHQHIEYSILKYHYNVDTVVKVFPSAYYLGGMLTFIFAKTCLSEQFHQFYSILFYHFEMQYILKYLLKPTYNVDCTLFVNIPLINYLDYMSFITTKPILFQYIRFIHGLNVFLFSIISNEKMIIV